MIVLRDYQTTATQEIRRKFLAAIRRILLVSFVGTGKTIMFSWLAQAAYLKQKTVLLLVHRIELAEQVSEKLTAFGVPHGFVTAGDKSGLKTQVIVGTVGSVYRQLKNIPKPDFIIVDEAKHAVNRTQFGKIIKSFPDAFVLGTDATPERLSGEGLGEIFQDIVRGPEVRWLIDNKYLCDYEMYAPLNLPDMSLVKTERGDYIQEQVEAVMNKSQITGDAIENYTKTCAGKPALVFCCSVKHAQDTARQFCEAGYKFVAVDGETPADIRKQALADLKSGAIHGVTNVNLFTEGLDITNIECVILLRPTKSVALYIQCIGRGFRPSPGKDKLIILDHAGCVYMHNLPCAPREWTLEGRKKRSRVSAPIPLRHCQECLAIYSADKQACPRCGCVQEIKHREIKQRKGALKQITPEDAALIAKAKLDKKLARIEVGRAQTKEELQRIANDRGYARGWVYFQMQLKEKRRAGQR